MEIRSVPRIKKGGIGTGRSKVEKDLSTKQHLQEKNSRVQAAHENEERAAHPEKKACQGKKPADCLIHKRPDLTFPRSVRVRSRADYLKVQRSGRKTWGRYLIILSMDNDLPDTRFGITVSRKTGNAVTRNRVKRRIREIQRLNRRNVIAGKDIIVIATREAARANFDVMRSEYVVLMNKAGLTMEPPGV